MVWRVQAVTNPLNTVYATKRLIGRSFDDEQTQAEAKVGWTTIGGCCAIRRRSAALMYLD